LFPGSGQSDRPLRIHRGSVENHSGVITLVVFCVFSVLYLKEPLKWNYLVGFGMMAGAVFIIFKEW